jgi:hypothetical protein
VTTPPVPPTRTDDHSAEDRPASLAPTTDERRLSVEKMKSLRVGSVVGTPDGRSWVAIHQDEIVPWLNWRWTCPTDFAATSDEGLAEEGAVLLGAVPGTPACPSEDALRHKLEQLWGWAKSGRATYPGDGGEYYAMDIENVDCFTDHVLRIFREVS